MNVISTIKFMSKALRTEQNRVSSNRPIASTADSDEKILKEKAEKGDAEAVYTLISMASDENYTALWILQTFNLKAFKDKAAKGDEESIIVLGSLCAFGIVRAFAPIKRSAKNGIDAAFKAMQALATTYHDEDAAQFLQTHKQ